MKRTAILVIGLLCSMTPASVHAIDDPSTDRVASDEASAAPPSMATYGDRTIDLREGWQGAQACYVQASGITCFDSERQMDEFAAATQPTESTWSGLRSAALRAACSTTLRLYDGISYATPVLMLSTRFTTTNLSTYGFDNATTSYRVGACAAIMWDGASGGGSVYPGNTSANASSPNMVTGWNNTISSVYLS